jgi:hypothetical protein
MLLNFASCDVRCNFRVKTILDSHLFCKKVGIFYVVCIYLRLLVSNTISISEMDRRDRVIVGFTTAYAISAYHH